jgi:hypothetical protein
MDLSQTGQTFSGSYDRQMNALRSEDDANRKYLADRNARYAASTQDEQVPGQQVAASGTPLAMPASPANAPAAPVVGTSAPAPSVTPMAPTRSQPYDANQTPDQTLEESARLARSGRPQTAFTGSSGDPSMFVNPATAQQDRLDELKRLNPPGAGVGPADGPPAAATDINAFNAGKQALQPGWKPGPQTDMTKLQGGSNPPSKGEAGMREAVASDGEIPTPGTVQAAVARTNSDIEGIKLEMMRQQNNPQGKQILQNELVKAQQRLAQLQAGSGQTGQTAPSAAPAAPQQDQGPKFTAADGSSFTVPQPYTDGQVAAMQQQAVMAKNAAHMAWMQYQQNPNPQTTMAYQQAVGQAQQLHQGLYDADIYAKTQQAQAGNPQAFSALLNEYSNKVGQPIQVQPEGNGMYSLRAQGGQVIAHGDPSALAGTLGGVLNSSARAMAMEMQKTYATESAKSRAQEDAKQPVELAKLSNALMISQGENATKVIMEKVKLGKITVTPNALGQFMLTDTETGKAIMVDPNVKDQIGRPTQARINTP